MNIVQSDGMHRCGRRCSNRESGVTPEQSCCCEDGATCQARWICWAAIGSRGLRRRHVREEVQVRKPASFVAAFGRCRRRLHRVWMAMAFVGILYMPQPVCLYGLRLFIIWEGLSYETQSICTRARDLAAFVGCGLWRTCPGGRDADGDLGDSCSRRDPDRGSRTRRGTGYDHPFYGAVEHGDFSGPGP